MRHSKVGSSLCNSLTQGIQRSIGMWLVLPLTPRGDRWEKVGVATRDLPFLQDVEEGDVSCSDVLARLPREDLPLSIRPTRSP